MNVKKCVFEIIQPKIQNNFASKAFDFTIMGLVFLNLISVFVMTFDIPASVHQWLRYIEKISLVIFSIEYLLRIWTADHLYPEEGKIGSRLRYLSSGMALIDLIVILPFFLPMFLPVNMIWLRTFRLLRLLQLLKLSRYSDAIINIGLVFKKKAKEMLVSVVFVSILLIVASLLIYYAEHDAQPEKFSNAFSGLWWAVATLTTVGYGDIYPVTALGKMLGAIIALMGIGIVAVPTGILSAGFVECIGDGKEKNINAPEETEEKKYCPHCGKKL